MATRKVQKQLNEKIRQKTTYVKKGKRPEISVLIPYYNDEDFLSQSIQSVLDQSYTDFELVLINHACTDSSRAIAHSFNDKRIIHVDLPTNAGAGGGVIFESFLNVARGEYLKLFCADDLLHDNFLEEAMIFFKKNPDKSIFFTDMNFIDSDGKNEGHSWFQYRGFNINDADEYDVLRNYFHGNSILPLPASIFKRSLADKIEIDYTLVMEFDVLLWMRLMAAGGKIGFSDYCFVDYRVHQNQTSSSGHKNKAYVQSAFEQEIILDEFMGIMDLKLLESIVLNAIVFDVNKIVKLKNKDVLAKFLYARFLLKNVNNFPYQRCGYKYIHSLFQDENARNILLNEYNYSIKDFRHDYSSLDLSINSDLLSYFYCGGFRGGNLNGLGIKGLAKEVLRLVFRKLVPRKDKLIPL